MDGLIVLLPYDAGQDWYGISDYSAYLPIYVKTLKPSLALMAVAHQAADEYSYVACPSRDTAKQWRAKKYPGTLKKPGLILPETEEAYVIPEPGDCFCCGSLSEFEVVIPNEMLKRLKKYPQKFLLECFENFESSYESILNQFQDWSMRVLNYSFDVSVLREGREQISEDSE